MLCSLVLQRKRHSWWRSNQVLHTYYIGLSSQVLWACYKGIILVYDLLSGTYNVCTYYSTITYYPLQASLCWQVLYSFPQYRCTLKEERHIISVRWKLVIICLWKDLRWPLFSDFWCLVYCLSCFGLIYVVTRQRSYTSYFLTRGKTTLSREIWNMNLTSWYIFTDLYLG
jgi:hypothetical protein